jgi:hypothetical protein
MHILFNLTSQLVRILINASENRREYVLRIQSDNNSLCTHEFYTELLFFFCRCNAIEINRFFLMEVSTSTVAFVSSGFMLSLGLSGLIVA